MNKLFAVFIAALLITPAFADGITNPGGSGGAGGTVTGGPFTAGDLVAGNGGSAIQDGSGCTTSCVLPNKLELNVGSFTPSSTLPTLGALGLFINESVTGTCASGCDYNYLLVNSDNVAAGSNNIGTAWSFNHNVGGVAATGNRVTGVFNLLMNGTTGNSVTGGSYSALGVFATGTVNDNGTGLGGSSLGQIEALNVVAQLKSTATNWAFLQAAEFDVSLATGTTVNNKEGIAIVQLSTDVVAGANLDEALLITNQAGAVGWKHGISFGQSSGGWPFVAGATAIGCFNSCGTLTNVIDFSSATISGNMLKSPGINIAGAAAGSVAAPNIDFVTCGTQCGLYSPASGQVGLTVGNTLKLEYGINNAGRFTVYASMEGNNAAGWLLPSNAASSTAPTLVPDEASTNTGFGAQASGNISAIVAGTEVTRFIAGGLILPTIASDATHTDSTVCQDTTTHTLLSGSGTAGICLGTSSARYKHDLADLNVGLAQIMSLEPVSYKLNADHGDPDKTLYGFTAEQGGQVLPQLMTTDTSGRPNTFDYLGVVPVLVRAMQQQQAEIEDLKRRVR